MPYLLLINHSFYICPVSNFKRIVLYLKPYRGLAGLNFVFNVFTAVFSLFSVVMVIPLLQLIFNQVPDVTVKPVLTANANSILQYIKYVVHFEIVNAIRQFLHQKCKINF